MLELQLPWLELAIASPLIGAILAMLVRNSQQTRLIAIGSSGIALLLSFVAWIDFNHLATFEAHDHWDFVSGWFGENAVVID